MCGIAGIIYTKIDCDSSVEVKKMSDTIIHRGPDNDGVFYDQRIALSHRRLSILDLSPTGNQPMTFLDRYVIVFNGEIYNYLELKSELCERGYSFSTQSDTEVLLAAYDFWGKEVLPKLNGMWAFIIYDKKQETVFCARDRFGVKPLYYTKIGSRIAFASEIKEFTVLPGWEAVGNKTKIVDFIVNDGVHDFSNETLFENVYQIRGGQYSLYDFKENNFSIIQWYSLRGEIKKKHPTKQDAYKTFYDLFEDSIRLRLRSDVKIGSCLSGGLDSSSIVCVIHNLLGDKVSKQEVVFASNHEGKYDESKYERAVVEKTGVIEHVVEMTYEEFLSELPDIVWHQDEPFGSPSIIAQWNVYRRARQEGLIVMLDGQGADEYLAGYNSFHRIYFRELLLNGKFIKLQKSLKQYKKLYKDYYYSPYQDLIETLVRKILGNKFFSKVKKYVKGEGRERYLIKELRDHSSYMAIRKENSSVLDEAIDEMLYVSLPKLLHHQDRNAMAHSVEARAPFLDYRLVEFVCSLPAEYKVHEGITKYIMRQSMDGIIPDIVKNRMDKLGFATPVDVWIINNNSHFRMLLSDSCDKLGSYVNKNVVLKEFDSSLKNGGHFDSVFWCIISVAAWASRFNVQLR